MLALCVCCATVKTLQPENDMTTMKDKTARTQGYCDRMRGQHLNPFPFDSQPQEFRDWIQGYKSAQLFEAEFADELLEGRG